MTSKELTQEEESEAGENLENGIYLAIYEKHREFDDLTKDFSKKQLRKLLDKSITFPSADLDGSESPRFIEGLQNLYAIKELQMELSIIRVAKHQLQQDSEQGELSE